jgi:hypothetical protein
MKKIAQLEILAALCLLIAFAVMAKPAHAEISPFDAAESVVAVGRDGGIALTDRPCPIRDFERLPGRAAHLALNRMADGNYETGCYYMGADNATTRGTFKGVFVRWEYLERGGGYWIDYGYFFFNQRGIAMRRHEDDDEIVRHVTPDAQMSAMGMCKRPNGVWAMKDQGCD